MKKITFNVRNDYDAKTCIITEYWGDIEVKEYVFSRNYNGVDIELFMFYNSTLLISRTEKIANMMKYLKGDF